MTDGGDWDFDHQRAETAWTIRDLCDRAGLSEGLEITLDLHFVPGEGADEAGFLRTLKSFGYPVAPETVEPELVQVQVAGARFALDDIWLHEERTTRIALARGYRPDGWGFWEP